MSTTLSPSQTQSACVMSKPLRLAGSRMIHISSPSSRQRAARDVYSFATESSFLPTKRSLDLRVQKGGITDMLSPQKRRKMETVHGTSTPRKTFLPSEAVHGTSTPRKTFLPSAQFRMDETLSTICGSESDADVTVVSAEDKTLEEDAISDCESEDEVCTILE